MNAYMNKNNGKLIAAIAIFAMIACVFAVAVPAVDAQETDSVINFDTEFSVTDAGSGASTGEKKVSNAELGNTIEYTYSNGTYTLTGTLNKQDIAYVNGAFTGVNQTDAAKGGFGQHWEYQKTSQLYWLALSLNAEGTITNAEGETGKTATNHILYLTEETKDIVRTITIGSGESAETYKLDMSGLEVSNVTMTSGDISINGVTFTVPEGTLASVDGNTITYTGTPAGAVNSTELDDSTTFQALFGINGGTGVAPVGHGYVIMSGVDSTVFKDYSGNVKVVQKNSALLWYNEDGRVSDKNIVGDTKTTSGDDVTAIQGGYAFLTPMGADTITLTVSPVTGTGSVTYTLVFDTENSILDAGTTATADDMNSAMQNGSTVIVNATNPNLSGLKVTDAGIEISGKANGETTIPVGEYTAKEEGAPEWTQTASVKLSSDFDGTIFIAHGSIIIDRADIAAGDVTITAEEVAEMGDIVIQDMEISGETTITVPAGANVRIGNDVKVLAGGNLTIANGDITGKDATVTLSKNNSMLVDGTLTLSDGIAMNVKGTVNSTITANEPAGKVLVDTGATLTIDGKVVANIDPTSAGTIINNSVSGGPITLDDGTEIDQLTSINGSTSQEIIVIGTVTVKDGGYINVNGQLTVQEGAELILEQGSRQHRSPLHLQRNRDEGLRNSRPQRTHVRRDRRIHGGLRNRQHRRRSIRNLRQGSGHRRRR